MKVIKEELPPVMNCYAFEYREVKIINPVSFFIFILSLIIYLSP